MPEPAGTGLSRRSFLLRSAGLALAVYGAGRLARLPAFEEGVARAQAGRRRARVLLSVFLDGGVDSLSRAGAGRRPALPPAAPDARRCATAGRRVRRGRAPGLAPGRRRRSPTCTPRARSPCCPPSATPPGPVALHLAPLLGGRRARRRACARAGSAGCSTASAPPTTRCRACRSDGQLAPSLATAREPGRRGRRRRGRRLLDARRVGRRRPTSPSRVRRARPRAPRLPRPRGRPGRARRGVRRRRARRAAPRSARTASRPTRPLATSTAA